MDYTIHPGTPRPDPLTPLTDDQVKLLTKLAYNATADVLATPAFETLSDANQQSILAHGVHAYQQLIAHGEPDPAYTHNNWLSKMMKLGWKAGDYFSEIDKLSPLLVKFEDLDDKHKVIPNTFMNVFKDMFGQVQASKLNLDLVESEQAQTDSIEPIEPAE